MERGSFKFEITMGIWEGEMIVKALEHYNLRRADERSSKEDMIRHLRYSMENKKVERTKRRDDDGR
jgi:hypothetical protein